MTLVIRSYQEDDQSTVLNLFIDAVHAINSKDYTQEQLDAWAPKDQSGEFDWGDRIHSGNGYVVMLSDQVVAFGTIDDRGFLDFLYVHPKHQRQKLATYLFTRMELEAEELGLAKIYTYSSITAKPFFEKMGFRVVRENSVEKDGVRIMNWYMEKQI